MRNLIARVFDWFFGKYSLIQLEREIGATMIDTEEKPVELVETKPEFVCKCGHNEGYHKCRIPVPWGYELACCKVDCTCMRLEPRKVTP